MESFFFFSYIWVYNGWMFLQLPVLLCHSAILKRLMGPWFNLCSSDHCTLQLCKLFETCFIFNDLHKCRYWGLPLLKDFLPFPLQHLRLFPQTWRHLESPTYNFHGELFIHLRGHVFLSRPSISLMSSAHFKSFRMSSEDSIEISHCKQLFCRWFLALARFL